MGDYGAGCETDLQHENLRKLFIGGLNRSTTDEQLYDYFSSFGAIQDHVVIKDPNTNSSRGFGFVTYSEVGSVENVLDESTGQCQHEIAGKSLDVKRAMPREFTDGAAHTKVKKLFVGGISKDVDENSLKEYLDGRHADAKCGQILNVEIKRDKETNQSKGFAFVEVSSTHYADRIAIAETQFFLAGKKATIKKAEAKGEGAAPGGGGRGRGGGFGGRGRGGGDSRGRGGGGGYGGGRGGYNSGGGSGGYGQSQTNGGYGGGYGSGGGSYGGSGFGGGAAGGGYGGGQGYGQGMTSYPNQAQYGAGAARGGYHPY